MNKYSVYITRTYIHAATIEVEAKSVEEAEKIAMEEIGNHDMSIKEMVEDADTAEVVGEL